MNKLFKEFCSNKLEHPDYYSEVTLRMIKSPITVLLGPNGTGKSMSIKYIKYQLDKQQKQCVVYSTTNNDIVKTSALAWGVWESSEVFSYALLCVCGTFFSMFCMALLRQKAYICTIKLIRQLQN